MIATLNAQPFYEKHGFSKAKRYCAKRNDADIPLVEMELKNGIRCE
jgi:hypothetical protein